MGNVCILTLFLSIFKYINYFMSCHNFVSQYVIALQSSYICEQNKMMNFLQSKGLISWAI